MLAIGHLPECIQAGIKLAFSNLSAASKGRQELKGTWSASSWSETQIDSRLETSASKLSESPSAASLSPQVFGK